MFSLEALNVVALVPLHIIPFHALFSPCLTFVIDLGNIIVALVHL